MLPPQHLVPTQFHASFTTFSTGAGMKCSSLLKWGMLSGAGAMPATNCLTHMSEGSSPILLPTYANAAKVGSRWLKPNLAYQTVSFGATSCMGIACYSQH